MLGNKAWLASVGEDSKENYSVGSVLLQLWASAIGTDTLCANLLIIRVHPLLLTLVNYLFHLLHILHDHELKCHIQGCQFVGVC